MTMSKSRFDRRLLSVAGLGVAMIGGMFGLAGSALAGEGQPSPWEMQLQNPASPVMENIVWFHSFLLWLITAITLFVLALLVIVVVKFNAKSNPIPSKTTHNTLIEVAWTIIPVMILVAVAVPSFRLLFFQLDVPKADLTIKATGNQWNWTYQYPDDKIEFTSIMLSDEERAKMNPVPPRLLGVDNEMVVPVNKVVRIQTTAADVIHSWAIPSFGVKIDAIPGRLNESWFRANREGRYYGQCSELCGKDHAFMPIVVRVVNDQDYDAWKKQQIASASRTSVASAGAAAR
ncbi:cytochrome C oxidase subunit II [Rhodopseudomonas sp. AAP120]|uniref:cytochrome c oxidase subunit II n=1 Tax=Rhodopseudomonas sp. AAP120 TaxID=1523430 RepID=UPI0006B9B364|nr:cytochrome c oxidase subunit II [Rhodopseudomonas sp. AAP120]KPG02164.1 cytochrome C oxidase subunit II [Rhodopseudomonas sp. AAP120]